MNTKAPTKKRSGLGSALAASLDGERRSVEDRFAAADRIFGGQGGPSPAPQSPAAVLAPQETERARPAAGEQGGAPAPITREKVIRDGFSFPPREHARIDEMLVDALKQGIRCNKSEIIRAALVAFRKLSPEKRYELIQSLEKPKPGRPA